MGEEETRNLQVGSPIIDAEPRLRLRPFSHFTTLYYGQGNLLCRRWGLYLQKRWLLEATLVAVSHTDGFASFSVSRTVTGSQL